MIVPAVSRIGEIVTDVSTRLPSRRMSSLSKRIVSPASAASTCARLWERSGGSTIVIGWPIACSGE